MIRVSKLLLKLECEDCGKEYSSGSNLVRHRKQHNKGSFNANQKDEGDRGNHENQVKIEQLLSDRFKSFHCEKCGISLSSLKLLKMHNVMVHP